MNSRYLDGKQGQHRRTGHSHSKRRLGDFVNFRYRIRHQFLNKQITAPWQLEENRQFVENEEVVNQFCSAFQKLLF